VWPWIVQMGYRRAGFYTYALLDNAGFDSADRILEEYQPPKIGDWMPMASKVNDTTAFRVKAFATNQWLLWKKPDSTWAWKLVPLERGRTRLVARLKQRYAWETPVSAILSLVLLEFGDFPMMRRVLKGIKARAERLNAQRSQGSRMTRRPSPSVAQSGPADPQRPRLPRLSTLHLPPPSYDPLSGQPEDP
jgi:hypothetical protein